VQKLIAYVLLLGTLIIPCAQVTSQPYPSKPIRIVTAEPGGGSDFVSRLIAQGIAGPLAQQVIIENRGGGAIIPASIVAQAPADGYTMFIGAASFAIWPLIQKAPYDAVRDFAPIALAATSPNILVVNTAVEAVSVKELIALAKSRPAGLNYASGAAISPAHLAAELFKAMAGVNIVHVPYRGSSPALIDLIAGQVQLMFATSASVSPHIKSGRLRALAVTSAQPSALLPGVPSIAASGVPGYESVTMYGIFAPAKTPAAVIRKLNQEIARLVRKVDVRERLMGVGVEAVGSTPEELGVAIRAEIARLGKVIKDAGIRVD
jgi:tripartite-type tricarboxylate transporter receptor subunit TctC